MHDRVTIMICTFGFVTGFTGLALAQVRDQNPQGGPVYLPAPGPVLAPPVAPPEEAVQQAAPPQEPPGAVLSQATLQALRDKGLLSQKDYEDILSGRPITPQPPDPNPVTNKWEAGLYGFVEADAIYDSTQSLNELSGNTLIARPDTFAGSRLFFSVRNSRIGFKVNTPEFHRVQATALLEMDFLGWGVSVDAILPIIPVKERKAWALTLNGSYVRGTGIADLFSSLTGGVVLPKTVGLTNSVYNPNLDNGYIGFDKSGNLQTVNWQAFLVGAQFYLPPKGNVWVAANYSQMNSDNADQLGDPKKVFTQSRWADANLFWDATPAVRFGAEYSWFQQTYADGQNATNHRFQFSAFYLF